MLPTKIELPLWLQRKKDRLDAAIAFRRNPTLVSMLADGNENAASICDDLDRDIKAQKAAFYDELVKANLI